MRERLARRRRLLAVVVAATVVAGACSAESDGASPSGDQATPPTALGTGTPAVVGVQTATGAADGPRDPRIGPPGNNRPALEDLSVGSCFNEALVTGESGGEVPRTWAVPCDRPHDAEVFAAATLDEPDDTYPGDSAVTKRATSLCLAEFESWVGKEFALSELRISVLRPDAVSWADGDRGVLCSVYDGANVPLVGTSAASAR